MEDKYTAEERMRLEELIQEKTDAKGCKWRKIYFGGGTHMWNWLEQVTEVYGEQNVEVEEANPTGLQCYEESGEKMYRIWARHSE